MGKDKRRAELDKFLAQSRELPAPPGNPSEQVIWLILARHGSKEGAERAFRALWKRFVDVNEFRVANRGSGRDPWFSVDVADHPWLRALGGVPGTLDPAHLRRSLMTFLMDLNHTQNPATRDRSGYSALERRGAAVFRDRCESCHAARLVSDGASTVNTAGWASTTRSGRRASSSGSSWGSTTSVTANPAAAARSRTTSRSREV